MGAAAKGHCFILHLWMSGTNLHAVQQGHHLTALGACHVVPADLGRQVGTALMHKASLLGCNAAQSINTAVHRAVIHGFRVILYLLAACTWKCK